MAARADSGKLYAPFTLIGDNREALAHAFRRRWEGIHMVGGLAIAMFVALVGWGATYFGWSDPDGKVQLALATTFILGVISGFKARG